MICIGSLQAAPWQNLIDLSVLWNQFEFDHSSDNFSNTIVC